MPVRRVHFITSFLAIAVSVLTVATASAQNAAPTGGSPAPLWANIVPLVFMFAILYIFMIRPQAKRQKMHQEFLTKLKRGDQIVTSSGMFGRVEGITDAFVTVEIADGVRVKVLRSAIASSATAAANAATGEAKA